MYLVYLGLPRPETHTTGTNPRAALTPSVAGLPGLTQVAPCPRRASRRTNGQQRLGHELVLGLGSGRDAAGTRRTVGVGVGRWRHRRLPTTSLCSVGRQTYVLVLLPQYTLYLCIWLCIWCVSASKTETHRYTRIRTPHPGYLTSRICGGPLLGALRCGRAETPSCQGWV